MKTIKIAKVPGTVVEVAVESNATVADILAQYGEPTDGYEVKDVNSNAVASSFVPADETKLYLVKMVKGN